MSTIELTNKIKELRELQALIEEAQAEAEAIKDALKAHMGESEELRAGEYKITWKTVTTSRLDGKALRAALPEVAARFTSIVTKQPVPWRSSLKKMSKIGALSLRQNGTS